MEAKVELSLLMKCKQSLLLRPANVKYLTLTFFFFLRVSLTKDNFAQTLSDNINNENLNLNLLLCKRISFSLVMNLTLTFKIA